jgi:CCR4-NOT transcription complex subunit 1
LAGELCGVLMHNILMSNNAASNFTIHKIWQHNPIMLIRGMVEVYTKDQSTLSRLLEIATQDLKALTAILDAKPFFFVIDLAALSSRREFLNLEKWLQDKIAENGLPFIKACFQHMRDRLLKNPKTESNQRLFDTLFIFYTCLQGVVRYLVELSLLSIS